MGLIAVSVLERNLSPIHFTCRVYQPKHILKPANTAEGLWGQANLGSEDLDVPAFAETDFTAEFSGSCITSCRIT